MDKPISWFEISVSDLHRARQFYESIFEIEMKEETMGPMQMAVFPYDREKATGGCLLQGPHCAPSREGVVLYLNAGDSVDTVLDRVAAAGGEITVPKTALPPGMGFFAHIVDTEGNRVGLHALK